MGFLLGSIFVAGCLTGYIVAKTKLDKRLKFFKRNSIQNLSDKELRLEMKRRNRHLLLVDMTTGEEEEI